MPCFAGYSGMAAAMIVAPINRICEGSDTGHAHDTTRGARRDYGIDSQRSGLAQGADTCRVSRRLPHLGVPLSGDPLRRGASAAVLAGGNALPGSRRRALHLDSPAWWRAADRGSLALSADRGRALAARRQRRSRLGRAGGAVQPGGAADLDGADLDGADGLAASRWRAAALAGAARAGLRLWWCGAAGHFGRTAGGRAGAA